MLVTLHDRQRQALKDFKKAAARRALREHDVATMFRDGNQANERELQLAQHKIEEEFRQSRVAFEQQMDETRTRMVAHYDQERARLQAEMADRKKAAINDYVTAKAAAEAEFKDSRWTILTLLEADRKVARNHLVDIQRKAKEALRTLSENQKAARECLRRWRLEEGAPPATPPAVTVMTEDPHNGLTTRLADSNACLAQLQTLGLPGFIKGVLPWIVLGLVWVVAALPALLLDWWYYWLLGATVLVVPLGWGIVVWLRREARRLTWELYRRVQQALVEAKSLRKRWLTDAREDYRLQRRLSRERNHLALRNAARKGRETIVQMRADRQQTLAELIKTYPPLLEEASRKRERDRVTLEEKAKRGLLDLEDRRVHELAQANAAFKKRQNELNRQHARDWTDLAAWWKEACERFQAEMRAIAHETERHFPDWAQIEDAAWKAPDTIPLGLKYGMFAFRLDEIANSLPEDPLLARPELENSDIPALLPFPMKSSMLFMARDDGRQEAVRAMEAVLLRCWTALPPGKARCTIIDPVGRGENFAAFMHLADHDESLVSARIWTEPAHIEQRLADLTMHMETVLQKYLRNQFETLADYNEQAGEVAEPFRFLVVSHFPVNFSSDAARRLISIAASGARCGVYTFILADLRQPLPHGINLEDLEAACMDFLWRPPRFLWPDEDFGVFPLTMETSPPAEACTQIMHKVGAAAQKALRVEVPFARLLPQPQEWWAADSRRGLLVPLGRAGATGLQWLNLGEGTSQHVLVAGKTGSGKSTLLHVIILQIALRYRPDEVELYLVDFKKGVEFKTYATHQLPHARVIAVESEREFGLSVLQKLDSELARRGEIFREAGVSDLAGYRNRNGAAEEAGLPRIFLIIDEFQEFFVEDDKVAQEAALLLDRLVRQGRAFGMHVLLGSQTLGGAYSLARSTIDQMAVRIALQCSEADAHLILSKDNTEARLLSRPGEAIYNASGGALEGNHLFQVAWLADAQRDDLLRQVLARDGRPTIPLIVFEGNTSADLTRNPHLDRWLHNHQPPGPAFPAWLGEAIAIKDPTAAVFRAQSGSNLLILGQQDKSAGHVMLSLLVGLGAQLRAAPGKGAIHMVLGTAVDDEVEQQCRLLSERWPVQVTGVRELPGLLKTLAAQCDTRAVDAGPQFLVLFGLHRLRELRRDENDFGFLSKPDKPATPQRDFLHVLREGPAAGIHTIVWCDNLANLQRSVERADLREFEMRVCFQMSAADSSSLLDTPAASKLGPYRALFFAEDQGKLEKFRPYGLPRLDWLQKTLERDAV